MTSPDPALPTTRSAVVRELTGLLLTAVGAAGLVWIAYDVDVLLGHTLLCLLAVVSGLYLLTSRQEE